MATNHCVFGAVRAGCHPHESALRQMFRFQMKILFSFFGLLIQFSKRLVYICCLYLFVFPDSLLYLCDFFGHIRRERDGKEEREREGAKTGCNCIYVCMHVS